MGIKKRYSPGGNYIVIIFYDALAKIIKKKFFYIFFYSTKKTCYHSLTRLMVFINYNNYHDITRINIC